MQRRDILLAIGASTAISGCIGNNNESTPQDTATSAPEDTATSTSEPTPKDTATSTPEDTTETETEQEPATLSLSNLSIDPSNVSVGENVSITVSVENTGGETGTRTIELQINGEVQDTTDITLEAGEEKTVQFEIAIDEPGRYDVGVGDLQGTVEVISEPDLTILNQELTAADTPFHNSYVEAVIENAGNARSGRVELTARWFDDSGSFVGEDLTVLPTLDAGETWIARVGTSREQDEIGDFELSGEYEMTVGNPPDGMSVVDSTFNAEDEYSGTITAEVENNREESLFMASFRGIIYDDTGNVIAGRQTLESDIQPGEDVFFELSLSSTRAVHRIVKAADHAVVLTESESADTQQF